MITIQSLLTLTIEGIFDISIAFLTLQFVTGAFLIFVTIRVPAIQNFNTPFTDTIMSIQQVEDFSALNLPDLWTLDLDDEIKTKNTSISAEISTRVTNSVKKNSDTKKIRSVTTQKQKKNDNYRGKATVRGQKEEEIRPSFQKAKDPCSRSKETRG
jgi:hypothetical protein